jgi:lactate dehydrogenase-like 2-hydroxyacid dehydrogenase
MIKANFEIAGLEGFELRDKTVGVFGTGKIE